MRYKYIASKFFYYLGVVCYIVSLVVVSFIFYLSVEADEMVLMIMVSVFSTALIILLLLHAQKMIYGKIDLERKVFLFGNMFVNQEAPIKEVKYVGKVLFYSGLIKLEIADQTFYYFSIEAGSEKNFEEFI